MWKFRKGSGTIFESWEKHGNGCQTRFSSAKDKLLDQWHCTHAFIKGCTPSSHPHLDNTLSSEAPTYDIENAPPETVHAWLQAAQNGDVNALAALFQLHNVVGSRLLLASLAPTATPAPSAALTAPSMPTALLPAQTPTSLTNTNTDEYRPGDATILERQGCTAHSMWPKIKVTINHCERLYHQLMDPSEFNRDKDWFFKFFATARNADDNQLEMVPYQLIIEAVLHRDKDIQEEKESTAYHDGAGSFSSELWHERWGNANSWEIWRMLEKKYYYKR
ncbi:hypothetical protein L208DRAFT_1378502 [Tricholoma matsutake]|nr:hypothetical protein L208DRAFT_1378502 [Tricholoma matsutake 945]